MSGEGHSSFSSGIRTFQFLSTKEKLKGAVLCLRLQYCLGLASRCILPFADIPRGEMDWAMKPMLSLHVHISRFGEGKPLLLSLFR